MSLKCLSHAKVARRSFPQTFLPISGSENSVFTVMGSQESDFKVLSIGTEDGNRRVKTRSQARAISDLVGKMT